MLWFTMYVPIGVKSATGSYSGFWPSGVQRVRALVADEERVAVGAALFAAIAPTMPPAPGGWSMMTAAHAFGDLRPIAGKVSPVPPGGKGR